MQKFQVSQNNIRLDLFLKGALRASRKQMKHLIDEGKIYVNERKVIIASWELHPKDIVSILEPADPTPLAEVAKNYFLKVLLEDEDLIVVEKEAGILCETSAQALKPSLPEIVLAYLKRTHPRWTHPTLIPFHRLDRDTSGVMVYGKKQGTLPLLADFKRHLIHRRYQAFVEGALKKEQGRIEIPLLKTPRARGKKVEVALNVSEGKKAITDFQVLQRFPRHTLLELNLQTGRTHQIRTHLAALGYPIVGDFLYGAKGLKLKGGRIALHASELGFTHPVTGKKIKIKSPLPKELRQWIEREALICKQRS